MTNVVILGMHRSGTSMLASMLCQAGLSAGAPEELMPAGDDNPAGFWERLDVVKCNDDILAHRDGSWLSPPSLVADGSPDELDVVAGIVKSLPLPYVVKDPRMVLTWPLWRSALPDFVVVYVYRQPLAVARSLQRRHGFPLTHGLALWEYYNRVALQLMANEDGVCISYEHIAAKPDQVLGSLLAQLQQRGVACQMPHDALFQSSLNHARDHDDMDVLLSPSQCALAALCERRCAGEAVETADVLRDERQLRRQLQDFASALEPLQDALAIRKAYDETKNNYLACVDKLQALNDEHETLSLAYRRNEAESHDRLIALESLQSKFDALDVRHDSLKKENEQLGDVYKRLLKYEDSPLGAMGRLIASAYKLLTLRRGMLTSYDEALQSARDYLQRDGSELPTTSQSKFTMIANVVRYVVRHPAGSLRSFSLARLRRAAAVFIKSSPDDLEVWVNSRFPAPQHTAEVFDANSLDEALDTLQLCFPEASTPRVSIVVPVYNNYRMTVQCLQALLDNTGELAYEVILADDASTDLTVSIAQRIDNIVVVRSENNQGFVRNCNAAAQQARGEFIVLLNNDTAVCDGWLAAMLDVMDARPKAGIVGAKLLFADGRLQEAGGIVWRDGSAWNYGRMDDADKPAYNYVRPVDYVSGACLMIRRQLWQQIGGFDERYVPAYYEDTDLAFAVREAGYDVLYQPSARVFHFEGASNGTDVGAGIKQYQLRNQQVFTERWQAVLASEHFRNGDHVAFARDRSAAQRAVLIIDHYVPHYDQDAGSRSTFMYVQLLLDMGYKLYFLGANYFPHQPYTETLQQMGVEVLVGEYMARYQDRWLQENADVIDCIYLHRPHIAEQLLDSLDKMSPRPPVIYFGHDLHYLRVSRELAVSGDESLKRSAENWLRRELAVFDRVDTVYYPSQVEIDAVLEMRPQVSAKAIPLYALPIEALPRYDFDNSAGVLFVGGFNHPPNVDGICWFVEQVLPQLQSQLPDMPVHIVGSNASDAVLDLQSERVTVHGYLSDDDLDNLYRRVRLAIVPLRFGAGVKGKVLEAIQKNVPLVTTTIGAEGIPDAESVMTIADTAEAFAGAIASLYLDDTMADIKMRAYANWLETHFSKARAADILRKDFGPAQRSARDLAALMAGGS